MRKIDLINKKIEFLFGKVGRGLNEFYYDDYYQCIYKVINSGGEVTTVLDTGKPTETIRILDAIGTYKFYIERSK